MKQTPPFVRPLLVLALALAVAAPGVAQDDRFAKAEVTTTKLADGIYMLLGVGGNLGVSVGDDGVFLIDDQYAPMTDKIQKAVKALSDKPIRFVLNTHWHEDHSGGNENLGKAGVMIVAHDNVRERMSTEQFIEIFGTTPPSPAAALPVVTYSDTVTFHLNGEEIHAFHVPPAHTDGDSIVHFRGADVVHMGDIYFNGMYPFIDVWSGGGVDGMISAVEQVLAKIGEGTKIIPGHGPLSNRSELTAYRDMLKATRDAVAKLVTAGKTLDEAKAAKPTAAYDEKLGGGFIKPDLFVELLYRSLKPGS